MLWPASLTWVCEGGDDVSPLSQLTALDVFKLQQGNSVGIEAVL
jgi:hypothetical protein